VVGPTSTQVVPCHGPVSGTGTQTSTILYLGSAPKVESSTKSATKHVTRRGKPETSTRTGRSDALQECTARTATVELSKRLMGRVAGLADSLRPVVLVAASVAVGRSASPWLGAAASCVRPVARRRLESRLWTQPQHHRCTADGVAGSKAPVCETHATEVDAGNTTVARHRIGSARAIHAHLLCRFCRSSAILACCAGGVSPTWLRDPAAAASHESVMTFDQATYNWTLACAHANTAGSKCSPTRKSCRVKQRTHSSCSSCVWEVNMACPRVSTGYPG
jgi:hypothetical protein